MLGLQHNSESPMIRLVLISWTLLTLCGSRASNEVLSRGAAASPRDASDLHSIDLNSHFPLVMPSSIQTGLSLGEQSSVVRDQSTLKTSSNLFQTPLTDSNVLNPQFSLTPSEEQPPPPHPLSSSSSSSSSSSLQADTALNSISHNFHQYSQEQSPSSYSYEVPPKTPSSKGSLFRDSELLRKLSLSSSKSDLSSPPRSLYGHPKGRSLPLASLSLPSTTEASVSSSSSSSITTASPSSISTQEAQFNPHVRDKRSASPNHHSSDSAIYLNTPLSRTRRDRFKHSWRRRKSYYGPPLELSNPSSASSRVLKQSSPSEFEPHSDPNPRNHHYNRRQHQQQNSNSLLARSSDTNNNNDINDNNNNNMITNNNAPLSQQRVPQTSYQSHRALSPESLDDNNNLWKSPPSESDLSLSTGLQEGPVVAASMSGSANLANSSPVEAFTAVGQDLARNLMMRTPRSGRRYEVPQIECPRTSDRMELFACPTPDFRGRYRCIDDRVLCNGFFDCPGHEDENPDQCLFYKTTKAHLDILAEALLRWARGR